jgi:hypothetical protein
MIGRSVRTFHCGRAFGVLALFAFGHSVFGQHLSVSIPNLKLAANERIVGFEIHVQSGMIVQLPKVPAGWNLSIDNDPSWDTTMSGSLLVGAAALDSNSLRNFLVVEAEKGLAGRLPIAFSGEVIVTSDFVAERRIKLAMKDFATQNTK